MKTQRTPEQLQFHALGRRQVDLPSTDATLSSADEGGTSCCGGMRMGQNVRLAVKVGDH